MSALKYKSNIAVPGVEFGNNVTLCSPGNGRLSVKTSTDEDLTTETRKDLMMFQHLVNADIEWGSTGAYREYDIWFNLLDGTTHHECLNIPAMQIGGTNANVLDTITFGDGIAPSAFNEGKILQLSGDATTLKCTGLTIDSTNTQTVRTFSWTTEPQPTIEHDQYATVLMEQKDGWTINKIEVSTVAVGDIEYNISKDLATCVFYRKQSSGASLTSATFRITYTKTIDTVDAALQYLFQKTANWQVTEDDEGALVFNPTSV